MLWSLSEVTIVTSVNVVTLLAVFYLPSLSIERFGISIKEKHIAEFLYIMKNMVYMQYLDVYTVGEDSTVYILVPENMNTDYEHIVSESACLSSPY